VFEFTPGSFVSFVIKAFDFKLSAVLPYCLIYKKMQVNFSFHLSCESRQSRSFRYPCALSAIICNYLRLSAAEIFVDHCKSVRSVLISGKVFPITAMSRDDVDLADSQFLSMSGI
jgi:hypothetical protein